MKAYKTFILCAMLLISAGNFAMMSSAAVNVAPNSPSNPSPADRASNVNISAKLSWSCTDPDNDTLTYDVYFGTSSYFFRTSPTTVSSPTYSPSSALKYSTTYYWKITAKDGKGGNTTSSTWRFTTEAAPNKAPTINSFTASPTTGNSPLTVTFSMSASDSDGTISSWDLDFGDGTAHASGSGTKTHIYTNVGTYTPKLTVTDNGGLQSSKTLSTAISVSAAHQSPSNLDMNVENGTGGLNIHVYFTCYINSPANPQSIIINYGDGINESFAANEVEFTNNVVILTATHKYSKAGDYTITLTVTDSMGLTNHESMQIGVAAASIFSESGAILGIAGLLVGALAVIIILFVFMHRGKSEQQPKTPSSQQEFGGFVVDSVSVFIGQKRILHNVSFEVSRGETLAIIGTSGCGKTTLLKSILGELKHEGHVSFYSGDGALLAGGIETQYGYVPQNLQLYENMSILGNMRYFGSQYGIPKEKIDKITPSLLDDLGILDKMNAKVSTLSGGQQRRASVAVAMVHSPKLLMLDEPTSGLDPMSRRTLWRIIKKLAHDQGVTTVVTTHFMDEAELSDKVLIMHKGKAVAFSKPENLKERLPGKGKLIELELTSTSPENTSSLEKAIDRLKREKIIQMAERTDYHVKLFAENPHQKLNETVRALTESGVAFKTFNLSDVSMTDVFVYMTGERYKEE